MATKRKRDESDESEESGKSKKAKTDKQVFRYGFTYSATKNLLRKYEEETPKFLLDHIQPKLHDALQAVMDVCDKLRLESKTPKKGKGKFIYQLEDSKFDKDWKYPEEHNPHFQGYISLPHKLYKKQLVEMFQELGARTIYLYHAVDTDKPSLAKYCAKSESRVGGPWDENGLIPVHTISKITEAEGDEEYDGSDLPTVYPEPFFQEIKDLVYDVRPDFRTINWIFDPVGGGGKSLLASMAEWEGWAWNLSYCKNEGTLYMVCKLRKRGCYFIDLPRTRGSAQLVEDMYQTVEMVKNGTIKTPKYEGMEKCFKRPHVWILSNSLPNPYRWTHDRLKVWMIAETVEMNGRHLVPFSVEECETQCRVRESFVEEQNALYGKFKPYWLK